MGKIKIDLSKIESKKGEPVESLNWANIPPEEGFIVLTHGEVREDIPDNVAKDLLDIGYAVIVKMIEVDVPIPEAKKEVKSKSAKKRHSRSKKK